MIKERKANEVTHICCLIMGDRFYFINDSKKEVWQLRFHTMVKTKYGIKKLSQCKNDLGVPQRFDANRVVVFLRRTFVIRPKEKEFSIDRYFA